MEKTIIGIRDSKEHLEKAVDYFSEKWGIERNIYADCISNSITTGSPLPRWYLMLRGEKIIGGYGLITNDFISRQDLYPWLCALFIEENERGNDLGAKLLEHGRAEAAKSGYDHVFLCTDLNNYYEKYGWKHIADGFHPWGDKSKIYQASTISNNYDRIFMGNPELETKRLLLRTLEPNDARDVFEYAKNPEVTRYVTWDVHKSMDDSYRFINWTIDRIKKDKSGDWGIQLKETNRIIGSIGFGKLDRINSCGHIGYVLAEDYWGQGLITEAIKRIIQFGFENIKLKRIEAVHFMENEASGRAMAKAGMLYEGTIRNGIFARGKFWDVKQYAIIKDDLAKKAL